MVKRKKPIENINDINDILKEISHKTGQIIEDTFKNMLSKHNQQVAEIFTTVEQISKKESRNLTNVTTTIKSCNSIIQNLADEQFHFLKKISQEVLEDQCEHIIDNILNRINHNKLDQEFLYAFDSMYHAQKWTINNRLEKHIVEQNRRVREFIKTSAKKNPDAEIETMKITKHCSNKALENQQRTFVEAVKKSSSYPMSQTESNYEAYKQPLQATTHEIIPQNNFEPVEQGNDNSWDFMLSEKGLNNKPGYHAKANEASEPTGFATISPPHNNVPVPFNSAVNEELIDRNSGESGYILKKRFEKGLNNQPNVLFEANEPLGSTQFATIQPSHNNAPVLLDSAAYVRHLFKKIDDLLPDMAHLIENPVANSSGVRYARLINEIPQFILDLCLEIINYRINEKSNPGESIRYEQFDGYLAHLAKLHAKGRNVLKVSLPCNRKWPCREKPCELLRKK